MTSIETLAARVTALELRMRDVEDTYSEDIDRLRRDLFGVRLFLTRDGAPWPTPDEIDAAYQAEHDE